MDHICYYDLLIHTLYTLDTNHPEPHNFHRDDQLLTLFNLFPEFSETHQWAMTAYNLFPTILSSCKQLQLLRNYQNFFSPAVYHYGKNVASLFGEQFCSAVFIQQRFPECTPCALFSPGFCWYLFWICVHCPPL